MCAEKSLLLVLVDCRREDSLRPSSFQWRSYSRRILTQTAHSFNRIPRKVNNKIFVQSRKSELQHVEVDRIAAKNNQTALRVQKTINQIMFTREIK